MNFKNRDNPSTLRLNSKRISLVIETSDTRIASFLQECHNTVSIFFQEYFQKGREVYLGDIKYAFQRDMEKKL